MVSKYFDPNNFRAAFNVNVRVSGDEVVDNRDQGIRQMLQKPASVVIELMRDVPEDLAVLLSGCVGVSNVDSLKKMEYLEREDLDEHFVTLKFAQIVDPNALPLAAEPGHPAEQFLSLLLDSLEGRELYRSIAFALDWARMQKGGKNSRAMSVYMYTPSAEKPAAKPATPKQERTDGR